MKTVIDPVKSLSDAISDSLTPHLERGAGLTAVRATNATDNQSVKLTLSVKVERNDRGRYNIIPAAAVVMTDTDKLETAATVFDPAQLTFEEAKHE
jgi:hypothetical protein